MRARLSADARGDLFSIRDYLEPRSPRGLQKVLSAVRTTIKIIEQFPMLGRTGRIAGTREINVSDYPYLIIYSLADEVHIDIDRVLHTRREYPPKD